MGYKIDIQKATEINPLPQKKDFTKWIAATLKDKMNDAELTIRIVDEAESAELNQTYRAKPGPTNVLAFPFEGPSDILPDLLGDLIICAPVVLQEAQAQNKSVDAHFAHLVVHGCLHLLGYDHIEEQDALVMEKLEADILVNLGYPHPYNG